MKAVLSTLVLAVCLSTVSFGQGTGTSYNSDSSYSVGYNGRYIKHHPDDKDCIRAYAIMEQFALQRKDTATLITICHDLLSSANSVVRSKLKEPSYARYSNVYNKLTEDLSRIDEIRGKYDSALYFLYLSDNVYKYTVDCANGYYMHRIINACRYADIYRKLGKDELAIAALLKEGLNHESNSHLEKLKPYLSAYDKRKLAADLNTAINNFKTDTSVGGNNVNSRYINFMGTKISFYYSDYDAHSNIEAVERKKIIAYLKQSELYKMVQTL